MCIRDRYALLFDPDKPIPNEFPKDEKLYHGLFMDLPDGTVKVSWSITVGDYVGRLHEYLIKELTQYGPKDNVRMIFWFNS